MPAIILTTAKRVLFGTFFLLAAHCAVAHEKPTATVAKASLPANPAADKVLAVVDQLRSAIKSGDAALAERAMAENINIFEQGHSEKSRTEYLDHHFKEDVVYAKAVLSVVQSTVVQVEGNMAFVTAHTTSDGMFNEKPIKNAGVETYVLRLRDGLWRIEHIHWSSRKRQ
ncbi:MAG: nuclear transport factor 2 family protein [Pseudomonadota bacterium]